ncbi:hypothetical protein E2C01_028486 [Portunus trituberculatus]|uniref:Uncharacterized protein n=1 Tax=Portunus trituberculatus TaxID=210409 RepID=A0A5B7EQ51_PORTR|nr:hypothetical protein [Portunus trituberculatus]
MAPPPGSITTQPPPPPPPTSNILHPPACFDATDHAQPSQPPLGHTSPHRRHRTSLRGASPSTNSTTTCWPSTVLTTATTTTTTNALLRCLSEDRLDVGRVVPALGHSSTSVASVEEALAEHLPDQLPVQRQEEACEVPLRAPRRPTKIVGAPRDIS